MGGAGPEFSPQKDSERERDPDTQTHTRARCNGCRGYYPHAGYRPTPESHAALDGAASADQISVVSSTAQGTTARATRGSLVAAVRRSSPSLSLPYWMRSSVPLIASVSR